MLWDSGQASACPHSAWPGCVGNKSPPLPSLEPCQPPTSLKHVASGHGSSRSTVSLGVSPDAGPAPQR